MKLLHFLAFILLAATTATPARAGEYEDAVDNVNRGDFAAAVPVLQALSDQGHARAPNVIGILYDKGRGVPQDDTEAARWYRLSAERGFHWGENNLGVMYRDGRGVPKDESEAVRWFRSAAEHGNAEGQNNLGVMYQKGRGVAKDDAEAVRWYRKAADQGLALAQDNLGVMLRDGRGVARDYAEAVQFFRLAADKGNAQAQENLGVMYRTGRGVTQDDAEAMRWFRKAVESGRASAQTEIAYMYETGRGVGKEETQALRWYWNAASQGNAYAQRHLGAMYRDGRGGERNTAAAMEWFGKAAAQGDAGAKAALAALQDELHGAAQAGAITQSIKAADAQEVAATVADAERTALAHEIVEVTAARLKFEQWVKSIKTTDLTDAPLPVPAKLKSALSASFVAAFSPDAVITLIEANLAGSLDAGTLGAGLGWEQSPVGRRMNELELGAYQPDREAARQELTRQYKSKGTLGDDDRARACAQADALGDQAESIVPFLEAYTAAGVLIAIELKGNPVDMETVQGVVARVRPVLREAARLMVMTSCLSDYRQLTDAEFEQWLGFLRSPDGGRYVRGSNAAMRQAMVARSAVMAQALLEAIRSYKRETTTSQRSQPLFTAAR